MISNDDIDTLARATAYGPDGDKLGRVGEVYLDNDTGRPAWITVVTGLFGTRRHFAPIDEAELDSSGVRLPFDKDTITGAPNIDENGELTPLEEDELYRYYRRFGNTHAEGGSSGDRGGFTNDRGGFTGDRKGLDERNAAGGGLVGDAAGGPGSTGAPHTAESYGTAAPAGTAQSPTAGTAQSPTTGTAQSPTTGTAQSPTTGTGHSPTASTGHSPTPPDVAREEIAGNYRPSEGQRDESLEHSMPGHTASTPAAPSGTAHSAADTARHAARGGTGGEQEIVGPGPTGPAHFTPPQPAGTDTSTTDAKTDTAATGSADDDRPRKPRLVRRVVTTEYYEESPDDATDTDRS